MKNSVSYISLVAVTGMMGSAAFAADVPVNFEERFEGPKPAVSAINGKIEAAYTYIDIDNFGDTNMGNVAGAISFPLGQQFGLQIDGGIAGADDYGTTFGGAVHAFWRNPDVALLGFYGDVVRLDSDFDADLTNWRFGAEGELYLDRFSVEAFVGADYTDGDDFSETYFSAEALAVFYATDDLRFHGGVVQRFDETYGRIGAEALLPVASRSLAVFGDGIFGNDVTTARVGLRVYFGEPGKSLIQRHREDDPRIKLFDVLPVADLPDPPSTNEPGPSGSSGSSGPGGE